MEQENQKLSRVMELFFENPERQFKVREISKYAKVPATTVQRYLAELKKSGILDKDNRLVVNNFTKFLKSTHMIKKLFASGLIGFLEAELMPSCVIIFGSARKGEYTKESDVDIFIETTKRGTVDVSKFEKKLKHKIQLFIEPDANKLPKELFNNVVNGIKLTGYLRIR